MADANIKIFSGSEKKVIRGIKYFDDLMLKKMQPRDCFYVFGVPKITNKDLKSYHWEWNKKRKFKLKIIYQISSMSEAKLRFQLKNTEVRITNAQFGAWFNIALDYVAIKSLRPHPICIILKNKSVKKSFKNFFDLLWKEAKRIR